MMGLEKYKYKEKRCCLQILMLIYQHVAMEFHRDLERSATDSSALGDQKGSI
jgi:hypothetical protein